MIKILLVEDNVMAAFCAKTSVEKQGYLCDIAENGEVAIEMFLKNDYSTVLMDISLDSGMNGYETAREIRLIEQKNKKPRTQIFALTSHAKKHVYKNCLSSGMSDVLEKPLDINSLNKLIQTTIV